MKCAIARRATWLLFKLKKNEHRPLSSSVVPLESENMKQTVCFVDVTDLANVIEVERHMTIIPRRSHVEVMTIGETLNHGRIGTEGTRLTPPNRIGVGIVWTMLSQDHKETVTGVTLNRDDTMIEDVVMKPKRRNEDHVIGVTRVREDQNTIATMTTNGGTHPNDYLTCKRIYLFQM